MVKISKVYVHVSLYTGVLFISAQSSINTANRVDEYQLLSTCIIEDTYMYQFQHSTWNTFNSLTNFLYLVGEVMRINELFFGMLTVPLVTKYFIRYLRPETLMVCRIKRQHNNGRIFMRSTADAGFEAFLKLILKVD